MKEYKTLGVEVFIQNVIDDCIKSLYEVYTMSSGTLVNYEMGLANEVMYKKTLDISNKKINQLIKTMNDISKILDNRNNKKVFNIRDCVKDTIALMYPLLGKYNLKIETHFDENSSRDSIEIDLTHLFLNIFKYLIYILTQEKIENKLIVIDIQQIDKKIEVSLTCKGKGMDKISSSAMDVLGIDRIDLKNYEMNIRTLKRTHNEKSVDLIFIIILNKCRNKKLENKIYFK